MESVGKQIVRRYILQRAKFMIAGGIILSIVSGIAFYFRILKFPEGLKLTILLGLFPVVGITLLVLGIVQSVNPFSAEEVKRNPEIFRQVEDLFGHEVYKDKFIVLSERVIGNADRILQMAYKDEVYLLYEYTQKVNGTTNSKLLKVETAVGTMQIDIMGAKEKEVEDLVNRICINCSYARVGHTEENLKYLEHMRATWRKEYIRKYRKEV